MRRFEHYRERTGQAVEDAFTQYEPKSKSAAELLTVLTNSDESKFNRTAALLSMVRNLFPLAKDSQKNLKYLLRRRAKMFCIIFYL